MLSQVYFERSPRCTSGATRVLILLFGAGLRGQAFGGLEAAYLRTELADDGGVVFRLVAGAFETKAAGALCARLKQREVDCFVPRPDP